MNSPAAVDKENTRSSLYSPGYSNKLKSKYGLAGTSSTISRKPLSSSTPTKIASRSNMASSQASSSLGAFGSLLMDASKDAQSDRDEIHARRYQKKQERLQDEKRLKEEEEGRLMAERLEEEENDKLLAERLLQEEREFENIEEEKRLKQQEKDAEFARIHEAEAKEEVEKEIREMETKDAEIAKKLLREEKDAILAERMEEAERIAKDAQSKQEDGDFEIAQKLHGNIIKSQKRAKEMKENEDRKVAKYYEINDMREAHREKTSRKWLDRIAAEYYQIFGDQQTTVVPDSSKKQGVTEEEESKEDAKFSEEKYDEEGKESESDFSDESERMTTAEFKLCHDYSAWQDAQLEIEDVLGGICVSTRLPNLLEIDFEVHEDTKEVELNCLSDKIGSSDMRTIHRNIKLFYDLVESKIKKLEGGETSEKGEEGRKVYSIEDVYSYSIHLQLDACVGVGISNKDITYSYNSESGVLYLYLNGLRMRNSIQNAPPAKKKSIIGKMYERVNSFRGKGGKK